MKSTTLLLANLAAALAMSSALACPADLAIEDGPPVKTVPQRAAPEARACIVHVPGNPKTAHMRRKAVSCERSYATRPAKHRDAA
jgi:hypothetical protein